MGNPKNDLQTSFRPAGFEAEVRNRRFPSFTCNPTSFTCNPKYSVRFVSKPDIQKKKKKKKIILKKKNFFCFKSSETSKKPILGGGPNLRGGACEADRGPNPDTQLRINYPWGNSTSSY